MSEPMLISIAEASKRLGVSAARVYELVRTGELKSVPVGSRNRKVPVKALEEYIETAVSRG